MGEIRKKNNKRFILCQIIIVLMMLSTVIGIEFWENRHDLKSTFESLELTQNLSEDDENYTLLWTFSKPTYVDRIKISGEFETNTFYTIDYTYANAFGKKGKATVSDSISTWFDSAYTPLDQYISSLKVVIRKAENVNISHIEIVNKPSINYYRVISLTVIMALIYILFFTKFILKRPEWFFVLFALGFGILTIWMVKPKRASWDEQIHFEKAYELANGKKVIWSEAAFDLANIIEAECNTKEEYDMLTASMDEKGNQYALTEYKESILPAYNEIAYMPMALFLAIGQRLGMRFSLLYGFGKLGNLLLYIALMYQAIKVAQKKKIFVLCIAMLPTPIFLAASYSYDPILFACFTLGTILWINMMFSNDDQIKKMPLICCVWLFAIGCLAKAIYIPILLLLILLPSVRRINKKRYKYLFILGILAVTMLVLVTFVLPTITSLLSGNAAYGADRRGGDTSVLRQVVSIIRHPVASVKLLFGIDNWTYIRPDVVEDSTLGINLFTYFALLGKLAMKWEAVVVFVVLISALYKDKHENQFNEWKIFPDRVSLIVILVGIIWLIWLSMYLAFTPVGYERVVGVQARYYLPLVYAVAMVFDHKKIGLNISRNAMIRFVGISTLLLEVVCMNNLLIQGRLL